MTHVQTANYFMIYLNRAHENEISEKLGHLLTLLPPQLVANACQPSNTR